MKKSIFLFSAVALMSLAAKAQTSFGLKAGANFAKLSNLSEEDGRDYQKINTLFHVTGYADIPLINNFSIQPGVSLQGKGAKVDYGLKDTEGSGRVDVFSIEVPVNFVYSIPAATGNFFLGAGPYVGVNVSAKGKATGDYFLEGDNGEELKSRKLKIGGNTGVINLIDAGANFLAGYKFQNGFLINAGYGLGLTKINTNGSKSSNRVFNVGVGFQF